MRLTTAEGHRLTGLGQSQRLTNKVPASTSSPISSPRATSLVQMLAVRPYSLSFISTTASSSLLTFITGMMGPNVSSVMTVMEWLTLVSRRGAT